MAPRALITGITGQDGSYLAEMLLAEGYEVHGLVRRVSADEMWRVETIRDRLVLHAGDLTERGAVERLLRKCQPDEVYNLAAMSFVKDSFEIPEYTAVVDGLAVLQLLEEIRNSGRPVKFYQASTSEMFGSTPPPQNESTPFHPRSPYGSAKLFAHATCVNYRESYGMHISCGLLFNHESPRRSVSFVTRKIARAVARIKLGLQDKLVLGNIESKRDWGHARDYVKAMRLMLQQPKGDDYVIATGATHSIKEFLAIAFNHAGLDWQPYVSIDSAFFRPADVDHLRGDASKARRVLGWRPEVSFVQLVHEMVDAEFERAEAASRQDTRPDLDVEGLP